MNSGGQCSDASGQITVTLLVPRRYYEDVCQQHRLYFLPERQGHAWFMTDPLRELGL